MLGRAEVGLVRCTVCCVCCVACGSGGGIAADAASDVSTGDGGGDAGPPPGNFHDLTTASNWSFHDLGISSPQGFGGGTFDGRYVYLAPGYTRTIAARYDTQGAVDTASSWLTFNLQPVNTIAASLGGGGASFDGRYVYYPNQGQAGLVMRYDVSAPFDQAGSWTEFDVATALGSGLEGGSTFDGRYLYFVAGGYTTVAVVRYDTQASFSDAASWALYKPNGLGTLMVAGATGAVFDGRYVYVVPAGESLVRYDTQGAFTSDASWSNIGVPAQNAEFFGGVFDGRSVFLVPYLDIGKGATVQRYDVQSRAFSGFDTSTLDPLAGGFRYGAFDGRYVYFVPSFNQTAAAYDGLLVRYDTVGDFATGSSWNKLDLTTLNPNAKDFVGAVFDGRYVYLEPEQGGLVARYDARDPPLMPQLPAFHGSFF